MDKTSGKMLNYRQLIRHPEYKGPWSLSPANEFGRLANGVAGRIKNPTNTIKFIRKGDIPMERRKDVTYGQFMCTVRPEKLNPTEHGNIPFPITPPLNIALGLVDQHGHVDQHVDRVDRLSINQN
ncbi:hypothetical protein ACHAXR_006863 [Thalassiosira sp. AJA248-18]